MFILREICKEMNVTTATLSAKTGIPVTTINEYRTRRKEPSLSKGLAIADALGIDPHELIKEDTE
ncbi:helix-turn-helix domain-containing protein [Bacteroides heparinolyticus]|uniref:helix-turn-helix domain-containing protein n=1 Tax=Prevotella heparinolytica TaxID=28113 RepID=UPI00359F6767